MDYVTHTMIFLWINSSDKLSNLITRWCRRMSNLTSIFETNSWKHQIYFPRALQSDDEFKNALNNFCHTVMIKCKECVSYPGISPPTPKKREKSKGEREETLLYSACKIISCYSSKISFLSFFFKNLVLSFRFLVCTF